MYLIRLDDASEYMNLEKWGKIEALLDNYDIKPIVGVIPRNQDITLMDRYQRDLTFWSKVYAWNSKGWVIAMHGYTHIYSSHSGGINPINFQSEFAGLPLDKQKEKIKLGMQVFQEHKLNPRIFFAPSHTFDMNTLEALKHESSIRIISDTVANDIYKMGDFYFIPQQSGHVQNLPFKVTTFCYHPNSMSNKDFEFLECFIKKKKDKIGNFEDLTFKDRKFDMFDQFLKRMYFSIRAVRSTLWRR